MDERSSWSAPAIRPLSTVDDALGTPGGLGDLVNQGGSFAG